MSRSQRPETMRSRQVDVLERWTLRSPKRPYFQNDITRRKRGRSRLVNDNLTPLPFRALLRDSSETNWLAVRLTINGEKRKLKAEEKFNSLTRATSACNVAGVNHDARVSPLPIILIRFTSRYQCCEQTREEARLYAQCGSDGGTGSACFTLKQLK